MKYIKQQLPGVTQVQNERAQAINTELLASRRDLVNEGSPNLPGSMNVPDMISAPILPSRLKFTLDNTGDSVNTKQFLLFDILDLIYGQLATKPGSYNISSGTLTFAQIKGLLYGGKLVFDSMKLEATTSETQFQNEIVFYTGDLQAKAPTPKVMYPEDALNSGQYTRLYQNFKMGIEVSKLDGLLFTVNASEKLYVTILCKAVTNL